MRISPLQRYFMIAALLGSAGAGYAQSRPAVVELFTSEGCSSCPPAEEFIGELAQRRDVLALTFHVVYWDDLGWRDHFGLPDAVRRQRTYAKNLQLSTIYTPQAVIDGHADFVGSDRSSIDRALAPNRDGVALELSVQEGQILIDMKARENVAPSEVLLVAYLRSAVTAIGRGENSGRTIKEFNIVREFHSLGPWHGQRQQYHASAESLPLDATDVAVLIQSVGQATIIGAATVALR